MDDFEVKLECIRIVSENLEPQGRLSEVQNVADMLYRFILASGGWEVFDERV